MCRVVFFCKQKTAYEMRISDWSSDVCSSDLNLQEAIDAPSFHSEHCPSSFWPREARPNTLVLEGRFPSATVEALQALGHTVTVGEDWSEGRLSACSQEDHGGTRYLRAGSNPRGMRGYAAGR